MKLLEAAGNGNGTSFELNTGGRRNKENLRTVFCSGTFGGATVTVEISLDEVTWFPVASVSFTALGAVNMEARAIYIRGVVTGGTGSAIDLALH